MVTSLLCRTKKTMNQEEIFTTRFLPLYERMFIVAAAILGKDSGDASDAVQDAMVRIWKSGHAMAEVSNPEGYAVAAVRSSAIDILRRRRQWCDIEEVRDVSSDSQPDPDSGEWLEKVIASLPRGQQEVVRLSAFGDMSNDEIASATGYSAANVRQLLSRGRKRIKELYCKFL